MISKRRFSLPRRYCGNVGIFPGRLVSYRRPSCSQQTLDGFFLAELIAAILVLFGAYQVLDAWIARVSREEREALEARQQAMMAEQQEGGHVSH